VKLSTLIFIILCAGITHTLAAGGALWIRATYFPEPHFGTRVIEVKPATALTQWACTKEELTEYHRTCRHRLVSALTKPRDQ
jgi:hypothetical protein